MITSTVSSPPSVPSTSGHSAPSIAEATIIAPPGGVRRTIWFTLPRTLPTSSAMMRCRREENIGPRFGSMYLNWPPRRP